MPANSFSTGRDCQVVLIGPAGANGQAGARVDLTHVTGFETRQLTHPIRVDRLDGISMAAELPKGWEGQFDIERGSADADDFIDSLEQDWFNNGLLDSGTLYQYINEADGSVTTFQFDGAVFKMSNAGQWKGDSSVKQRLEFFASRRTRL